MRSGVLSVAALRAALPGRRPRHGADGDAVLGRPRLLATRRSPSRRRRSARSRPSRARWSAASWCRGRGSAARSRSWARSRWSRTSATRRRPPRDAGWIGVVCRLRARVLLRRARERRLPLVPDADLREGARRGPVRAGDVALRARGHAGGGALRLDHRADRLCGLLRAHRGLRAAGLRVPARRAELARAAPRRRPPRSLPPVRGHPGEIRLDRELSQVSSRCA